MPRRYHRWYWGRLPTGHVPCRGCNCTQPLPVHLLDGLAADLQALGQFPLAHSLRPFHLDVLPLCSVKLGCRPKKRASARTLAWPATERSLIEFRHHSLKASTIERWSRLVAVHVSKSSDRNRNSAPILARPSITCSPQVSPVSGGVKVDRVCGRSVTFGG